MAELWKSVAATNVWHTAIISFYVNINIYSYTIFIFWNFICVTLEKYLTLPYWVGIVQKLIVMLV